MANKDLVIVGAHGSPYSRKMRAVLRYRRIPYRWVVRGSREDRDIPDVPVALIPVLVFDDEAMIDSTWQITRLEKEYEGRSVIPPDPALAFIDELLEDFADEWLTKAMFHYRWAYQADIEKAGRVLPLWGKIDMDAGSFEQMSEMFTARQVGRLAVVGSNETTGPLIEESYVRTLRTLQDHLHQRPFLFGRRPGRADFAVYGQLTQLALFDPTPAAVSLEEGSRTIPWCHIIEDLSGMEPSGADWDGANDLAPGVGGLLAELGRVYAPFLLANATAIDAGSEQVDCEIDGRPWTQKSFPYQAKCLGWLRGSYGELSAGARATVDSMLAGTGCERLF